MLKVIGFGTDAANETFSCNIWGWSRTPSATPIWIPTRLMTATFTLGTQTGAAGADILDTELIADTVVAGAFQPTFGGDNWIGLLSPADNTTAMILLPTIGTEYIEFDVFDVSTASCNVLAGVI